MSIKNSTLQPLLKRLSTLSTDKLERLVLETAVYIRASDVHIEPHQDAIQVRFRVDGLLRPASQLPYGSYGGLVSHIKSQAGLRRSEHSVPQAGAYKTRVNDMSYMLQVSVLPVTDGEKIVIQLSNEADHTRTLPELGFWGQGLRTLNEAIVQPHGLVLFSGPVNSGASATMYAILGQFDATSLNIATIEDPIRYRLPGINQTQLNHKAQVTFSAALRALRRQDADIIMVSENRDSETARLTVETALAGRLVLSGIHATSAAAATTRLSATGIEPYLSASVLRTAVDQRLARRLCLKCRILYDPTADDIVAIRRLFGIKNSTHFAKLRQLESAALGEGLGKNDKKLSAANKTITRLYRANPRGCNACSHTGYKGQIGICEVLPVTDDVRAVIASHASADALARHAADADMVTLRLDGLVKALRGLTTVEEILRLTY